MKCVRDRRGQRLYSAGDDWDVCGGIMKATIAKCLLLGSACAGLALVQPGIAAAAALHADTFETGDAVSYFIRDGAPAVNAAVGPFATRSLRFNLAGNTPGLTSQFNYEQIQYAAALSDGGISNGPLPEAVVVSFDVFTQGLIGTDTQFSLLLDVPTVRNIRWLPTGQIRIENFGATAFPVQSIVGSYAHGQATHVVNHLNYATNQWRVFLDGALVYSGVLDGSAFRGARFNLGVSLTNDDATDLAAEAYLDNVLIQTVPVPAALPLLGCALAGLAVLRRAPK
jgi:hypothetical protein